MTTEIAGIIPEFTIGERLAKARKVTGLDQTEFADRIGVVRATVSSAERDQYKTVRPILLNAWSLATGVPRQWLETGEAPEPSGGPEGEEGDLDEDGCAIRDSNPEPAGLKLFKLVDVLPNTFRSNRRAA